MYVLTSLANGLILNEIPGLFQKPTARRSTSISSVRECSWPRKITIFQSTGSLTPKISTSVVQTRQLHPAEVNCANQFLQVIKACQSLTSRGYLKTQFSWQWYYYTLTPEGLDYLREWLHLPAEIVPATHIKQQRSHAPPRGMMGGDDRERRPGGRGGPRGDREGGYRRRDAGEGKEGGAPGEFAPTFRGGFGRGRGDAPS